MKNLSHVIMAIPSMHHDYTIFVVPVNMGFNLLGAILRAFLARGKRLFLRA